MAKEINPLKELNFDEEDESIPCKICGIILDESEEQNEICWECYEEYYEDE